MTQVPRKTEVGTLDGTPEKRLFWSIISDYDLKTGICELVDNAHDQWQLGGRTKPLNVSIILDEKKQLISVTDNAGGVKNEELRLLITPGGSKNDPGAEVIGIFGVGSKRAAVALGEHIEIRTRYRNKPTYQIDVAADWLDSDDWDIPHYEIPNIAAGTTRIEITRLRKPLNKDIIEELCIHLGEVYGHFLGTEFSIEVNGVPIAGIQFKNWAFPPEYEPTELAFSIEFPEGEVVDVKVTGGLIADRNRETENYGVYFYCNDRLIVKELKTRDVGYYVTGEAGVPHPDASLCRIIVEINGPAKRMPWNSSKTGINTNHDVFIHLRPSLLQLITFFSSLSRRLKANWPRDVFRHIKGRVRKIKVKNPVEKHPVNLPNLPRINKPRVERLKSLNKKQIENQPWTLGLVESIGALDIIKRQRFETKNRIALILLDSNFEISLKEFIVHRDDLFPANAYTEAKLRQLFKVRRDVIAEVSSKVSIPKTLITKAEHYYVIRNKLIHERATVGIADAEIEDYRNVVGKILKILFNLKL